MSNSKGVGTMERRSFEEMQKSFPDWTGLYYVFGPFPGDEVIVDGAKLASMQDTGETTNCNVVRMLASDPRYVQNKH
jgi:hypothetical protein